MAKKKRCVKFQVAGYGKREFSLGLVYRFKWNDVYRSLQAVHNECPEGNLKTQLNAILNSSKEAIVPTLYAVLEAILVSKMARTNMRVRCAGWVIACYGYTRGIQVPGENSTFPLPRSLRRIPKPRFRNIRLELFCPLCKRPFIPPKNYRTDKAITKWFSKKLMKHMELEHGG